MDLVGVDVEFFCGNELNGSQNSLSEFHFARRHDDAAVILNGNPSVEVGCTDQ